MTSGQSSRLRYSRAWAVLLLVPERGQIARADDDVRLERVDLVDRPLEQVRDEVRRPAVQVGQVRDHERSSAIGRDHNGRIVPTEVHCSKRRHPTRSVRWSGRMPPRFANDTERDLSRMLDFHGIAWQYEPHTFVLEAGAGRRRARRVHAGLLPARAGSLHRGHHDEAVARDEEEPQDAAAARAPSGRAHQDALPPRHRGAGRAATSSARRREPGGAAAAGAGARRGLPVGRDCSPPA